MSKYSYDGRNGNGYQPLDHTATEDRRTIPEMLRDIERKSLAIKRDLLTIRIGQWAVFILLITSIVADGNRHKQVLQALIDVAVVLKGGVL